MRDKYLVAVVSSSGDVLAVFAERIYSFQKCNLKPANMRGIKSFAMVLAVSDAF